jgi:uncharacterized protein
MSRPMIVSVVSSIVLLVGLLVLLRASERRLMYFPVGPPISPDEIGLSHAEPVAFTTVDGITLHGWFLPGLQRPAPFTVVVFNGNAGNRSYRAPLAVALQAQDLAVLLFDYRGYGENRGSPTEEGLAADARAAREFLVRRADVNAERLVYFGESLGSAVAVHLAAEHSPAALVLRSPFASMADVGQHHYPFLPVRLLLRDRYASIDRIRDVRCPVLVIAGAQDRIVPLEHSRRLYEAVSSAKKLVILPEADHNDAALASGRDMIAAIVQFLASIR